MDYSAMHQAVELHGRWLPSGSRPKSFHGQVDSHRTGWLAMECNLSPHPLVTGVERWLDLLGTWPMSF